MHLFDFHALTQHSDIDECHIEKRRHQHLEHDGVHVNGAAAVDDRRRMKGKIKARDDKDEKRHGQKREQGVDGRDAGPALLLRNSRPQCQVGR